MAARSRPLVFVARALILACPAGWPFFGTRRNPKVIAVRVLAKVDLDTVNGGRDSFGLLWQALRLDGRNLLYAVSYGKSVVFESFRSFFFNTFCEWLDGSLCYSLLAGELPLELRETLLLQRLR